jgi:hypothetical protein
MPTGMTLVLVLIALACWVFIAVLANSTLNTIRDTRQYLREPGALRANSKKERLQKSALNIAWGVVGIEAVRLIGLLFAGQTSADSVLSFVALFMMVPYFVQVARQMAVPRTI